MAVGQALLQQTLPVLDLGAVDHQYPGGVDPLCLQLLGHGQPWRGYEQNPAAVALAQSSQRIQQRGFMEIHGQSMLMLRLALMAGGPGGDHTGRGGEWAMTQGLAHMCVLYE
ncbi:hypothetical protein D3C86_758550 [compost metagenome]